jgi:hypothetical protein
VRGDKAAGNIDHIDVAHGMAPGVEQELYAAWLLIQKDVQNLTD